MTHTIKDNTVAVDQTYFWQAMATCPRGVKVQLLGDGVAHYGQWNGNDPFWRGWAPVPTVPNWMKQERNSK